MSILATDAYRFALGIALGAAREKVSLASAYVTVPGVEWVLARLPPGTVSLRVVTRWNCGDLVSGASDLDVYPLLQERGASLFVLPDLHAKAVLIDSSLLLIGSANITTSGLRLVPGGNREIGVEIAPSGDDVAVIDGLFDEAVEVRRDLYEEMRDYVRELKSSAAPREAGAVWSATITGKLTKKVRRLWVTELLWCPNPNVLRSGEDKGDEVTGAVAHDRALLGVEASNHLSDEVLAGGFLDSRAWRWLTGRLEEAEAGEMYFGRLSAALHDALLDDPKPYRQDVKTLVSNLLAWAGVFGRTTVAVDRPNYSQRVRLIRQLNRV